MANAAVPFTVDVGASLMCDTKGHASMVLNNCHKHLTLLQDRFNIMVVTTNDGDDNDAYDENDNDGGDDSNKRR